MSDEQSFISHLLELRDRLLRMAIALTAAFLILLVWPGASAIYDWLAAPLMQALPEGTKMIATGVVTPFFVPMKVTIMVAFVLVLPYLLYQIWSFVAPGLYSHEKRFALPMIVSSTALFFVGMAFCYYFVFGKVFTFINQFAPKSITPAPDIEAYLSFVLTMFVAFGVTFEVPVVVVALVRMGLVTVEKLVEVRSYFIVVAFVVAAIVTPPDVLSQFMLAIPMMVLYELGIIAARLISKPKPADDYRPLSEAEMDAELDRTETSEPKS